MKKYRKNGTNGAQKELSLFELTKSFVSYRSFYLWLWMVDVDGRFF